MGAGSVPRHLATGSLGLSGIRLSHKALWQSTALLRMIVLIYSEGKYLSEQMMFLSS